jgi:hypothetical protein
MLSRPTQTSVMPHESEGRESMAHPRTPTLQPELRRVV